MLVAVSGGVDSTALLLLAAAVAARRRWRIEAATVDHHLRDDSALDAAHACEFAASIGVLCHRLDVHPGRGPGAPARARLARLGALAQLARRRSLHCVLTGHHAHDQMETMLLALARGAGARSLGGMPARRSIVPGVALVRPLLEIEKPALERLCRRLGVVWREDPSNADPRSPRTILRQRVTPVLEALRPGAALRASRTARLLREAGRRFERAARRIAQAAADEGDGAGGRALARERLRRLPIGLRCEVIRAFLRSHGLRIPSSRLREIAEAAGDRRRHRRQWPIGDAAMLEVVARRVRLTGRDSAAARDARCM